MTASSPTRIQNAVVDGTSLGREDHGIMTGYIFVKGDGWSCGFGGYAFDEFVEANEGRRGCAFGMEFVARVLETLEVSQWEKLKGTPLRVEIQGWGGGIVKIGHYLKDNWFNPSELAEEMRRK